MKQLLSYIVVVVLGIVIGLLCRVPHYREMVEQTDTIIRTDTVVIEKPVLVERTIKDSLLVAVHDTIVIRDSVFVPIPIERKTYKGEDYFAEISGYKANLERIEVYPKTTTIYRTEKETVTRCNRLRLGIEANYYSTPFVPIYLEYERKLHRNIGINAKFFYDFNTRLYGVGAGINVQIGW